MKKQLIVNANEYILLEFLKMFDYFIFENDIKNYLTELKLYLNKKIYGDFFDKISRDISNINHILEFTFE